MNTLIFVAIFCIAAVLVYMARYSGRVRVEQARTIVAPLDAVYTQVADLRQWQQWNPWLDPDSDDTLVVSAADAHQCEWESSHMGSGQVQQLRGVEHQLIEHRLRLRHPFSLSGKCQWTFKEVAGKTEVTWTLRGRVAFTMRAFSATVQSSLALDCRYGLDRLASLLEPTGAPRYTVHHLGVREVAATRYVYRNYQGPISGLQQARETAVAELQQELDRCGVPAAEAPVVLYFKTNIKLRTTVCHIGIPVAQVDGVGALQVREIPAHRAYVARLMGSDTALEIAWYLAMQRMVAQRIQPDQRMPPFEIYLVNSQGTPENERVIELYLPVLQR